MAVKLNDKQVKSLLRKKEPGYFAAGNGLYFRVSKEGTGFWLVRYTINKKRREISIGRYPDLTLANATVEAAKIKIDVREGIDPQAEKKRPASVNIQTVDELAEDWLKDDIEKRLKHPHIPRRIYEKNLSPVFGDLSLDRITPMDVRGAIDKIVDSDRPTIANDALMYCKQLFRHGIRLNLMTTNPADAFTVHHAGGIEQSRSRSLSIDELSKIFSCFQENTDQFTRENYLAVALLLALGVRKGELIAAEWSEFDLNRGIWDIPQERSKTGVGITVPLPPVVVEWLQELRVRAYGSEYVFPKRRKSKRNGHISPDTLNAAIQKLYREKKFKVDHFTVHDLRRTCRSLLAGAGVPGHVAERCLNHKLKGVEGIYDRYDYFDERREALQKIAEQLAPIVNPGSNVAPFKKRRKA